MFVGEDCSKPLNAWGVMTILAAAAFALYGITVGWDFVFDDFPMIVDNEKARSLGSIADFFTGGVWHNTALIGQIQDDYYRPLHMTFLAVNYQLWGGRPFGFHLLNILIHTANSILVYFLAKSLLGGEKGIYPLLGALLFVVHPVHVEPVNWVCGSTDLLLAFFLLSSLLTYAHSAKDGPIASGAASVVLFICALLTKEVAVVFPVVICAYDLVVERKVRIGRWLVFATVAVGYLFVRKTALGVAHAGALTVNRQGFARLFEYMAGYLQLSIWPWPITMHQGAQHFGPAVIIFALAVLSGMVFFAITDRRRVFPLIWYGAFIAPPLVLSFAVQHDAKFFFADRYLYLPSVGIAILFASLLPKLFKTRQRAMVFAMVPLFLLLAAITVRASMVWQNNATLFSALIEQHPDRMENYRSVGEYYERHGQGAKAIETYKAALLHVRSGKDRATIFDNMGRTYGMGGQPANAVMAFNAALSIDPRDATALTGLGNNSADYAQASYYYSRALEADSGNFVACNNLVKLNEVYGHPNKAAYYKERCQSLQKGYTVKLDLPARP